MISASKGNRIIKSLLRKGLVREHTINLGGRGGLTKFLSLTEEGYKAIGVSRPHVSRGGGFEHDFWIVKISERLKSMRNDWKVSAEKEMIGKFVDIVIEFLSNIIGIEVAITAIHEKANLEKDILQSKCNYVIVGCRNEKVLDEVKGVMESMDEAKRGKIGVGLLHELLKCNALSQVVKSEYLKELGL